MCALSATQTPLPLQQCPTVLLQPVHRASIHVNPGGRSPHSFVFTVFFFGTCDTELQNRSLPPTPPPQQASLSSTVKHLTLCLRSSLLLSVCLSVHLLFVLWHCCAGSLRENIFYKSCALQGMGPSKNKWMACFSDLRTMKSPPFALSLT